MTSSFAFSCLQPLFEALTGKAQYGGGDVCIAVAIYTLLLIASIQVLKVCNTLTNMVFRQIGIIRRAFFGKAIDPNSKRHGGELVASVLKSHGIDHIFTLSGGHISPILVGAEKLGIRVVDTRHEVTTVFAADATVTHATLINIIVR